MMASFDGIARVRLLGRLTQACGWVAVAVGALALLFAFSPANVTDAAGLLHGAAYWLPIGGVLVVVGTLLVRGPGNRSSPR